MMRIMIFFLSCFIFAFLAVIDVCTCAKSVSTHNLSLKRLSPIPMMHYSRGNVERPRFANFVVRDSIQDTPKLNEKDSIENSLTVSDDEDELIKRINQEIMAESGVQLEDLINPSKVVNLERDILQLSSELSLARSESEQEVLRKKLDKKRAILAVEKRAVFRGWLKQLFIFQSVLAAIISLGMVYDSIPGVQCPLSVQVLGFWMWWLFIIPSLRARKPSNQEKEALNIAFLTSPVLSLLLPAFTKDTGIIWWSNLILVVICYVYAFTKEPKDADANETVENESSIGKVRWLGKVFRALDYGSGQERGERK